MISDLIHTLTSYIAVISIFFLSFFPPNASVKGERFVTTPSILQTKITETVTSGESSPDIITLIPTLTNIPEEAIASASPIATISLLKISPSLAPTSIPTQIPTKIPTVTPTSTPAAIPTKISTKTPTFTPTLTLTKVPPSPTPSPTIIIVRTTVIPSHIPTNTPIPVPSLPVIPSLNADLIFNLVNNHRNDLGLPVFKKDVNTCQIAASRAPQVYNEVFVTDNMHAGFYALNLPYRITENIIYYDSEQGAYNWWMADGLHRKILEGDYKYSCVACYGYGCSQVFTSYIPR